MYLFTCNKCKKQYTGQTTDNFRGRWNKSLKVEVLKGENKYFESEGHTEILDDVSITLIDKTDGSNPTKRENYWMRTLKTYASYGLNVVDSI